MLERRVANTRAVVEKGHFQRAAVLARPLFGLRFVETAIPTRRRPGSGASRMSSAWRRCGRPRKQRASLSAPLTKMRMMRWRA
eukprot:scaffold13255_cov128-Isochrysis_galbana.AAC.12